MRTALAALVLALAFTPAYAQQPDEEGCKDHPMFSRMPNYFITSCEDQEFGVYEFSLGDSEKRVEGRDWSLNFEVKEGVKAAGPLQIGRNYWNAMAPKGGKRYLEDLDSGGGTMSASMPGPAGGGTVWVQVQVSNSGEMYSVTVVQEAGMRQDVELNVKDMADALARTGSVTLNNILFDTGKATITAASEAPLKVVVELLKGDAALRLEIQGHTDNVGGKDANLKLSKDRADAVKAYLVKAGIDAARLTTAGFGDAQPVADNATDAGRAQNRRVVLVRKP
jgi:outer membrane protein OmpA-like peptidoglycan-associated protein